MTRKTVLAAAMALVLALSVSACGKNETEKSSGSASSTGITWMGYTDGMKKAAETGKPVLVDFYTTWCKYCKLLDTTTYKDPRVVEMLNRDFVAVKVNAEGTEAVVDRGRQMTERDLTTNFRISGYPTLIFFDTKGKPIIAFPGYQTPEELSSEMTYISSGVYAKGTEYADYLKSTQKK